MIRRAEISDVQSIKRIADNAYRLYVARLGRKPAPMVADFANHILNDWVIVFEQAVVLGYAVLLVDGQSALLDNIAVDPSTQQQGVGKALINHVEQHLLKLNHQHYDLYTNLVMVENLRWYQKLGFIETRRIEEKGFKRIYLRKQLGPAGQL